ncbi:vWA domain-containing protein [Leifsonia sp. Leaf264]|uniref:vWA domain-containing protein n=1 Tax=Leifsonia sp. Leaf264 TaxID=1736314 RepID=UPI0006F738BB|nr:vWA domain-containing protein [Leifsonia sp. Leaf264]KQO98734.1 hypothetical protein ASF30_11780 [Leifsonia sp. Leaf264]
MEIQRNTPVARSSGASLSIGGKTAPLERKFAGATKVDVGFVFDTTGSMSAKRDSLIESMSGFIDELAGLGLDWRVSAIPFGDLTVPGDRIDSALPFVTNVAEAKQQLRGMPQFSGGGNEGESSIEAMSAAVGKAWRNDAVKVLVLLTDDYALNVNRATEITSLLTQTQTLCFAAALDTGYYRDWCTKSGGEWTEIASTMDTGSVLRLIRTLVSKVAITAAAVHAVGGGSVRKYLEITGRS